MAGDPVEGPGEDQPTAIEVLGRARVATAAAAPVGADSVVAVVGATEVGRAGAVVVAVGAAVVAVFRSFSNEPWSRIRGSH